MKEIKSFSVRGKEREATEVIKMQIKSKLENAILDIFVFFLQVLVSKNDFHELALWVDLLLDDASDFGLGGAC